MKQSVILVGLAALVLAAAMGGTSWATGKCGDSEIANGPFSYSPSDAGSATFLGSASGSFTTSFTVTAPSASGDNVVFPGEGQHPCVGQADATVGVFEITKVADADGNLLASPVSIDSVDPLYSQIAGAFAFDPSMTTFTPGSDVTVSVTISNPEVSPGDYGQYMIKMAAQAPGAGIGVGPGSTYALTLGPAPVTDTTPPTVNVTKPNGDQILGVIDVEVQATDPTPGSGVASMSATVSSAGGTVLNAPITLTPDQALPVAAGITVTGTGTFTPTGGSGPGGTTDALAFTAASRSGIGSYTINAQATDVAANTGYGSKSFAVNYAVAFSQQSAPPSCPTKTGVPGANCTGMFEFSANRSSVTSDGAFMYDHTVVVKLVRTSDSAIMATHGYGTGSVLSFVQITATPSYLTHFKRGDLVDPNTSAAPTAAGTYVARVYFQDVDGNLTLQGQSTSVTF